MMRNCVQVRACWFVDRRPEEDVMESVALLDLAGRRSPATLSSFHLGRPPRNKGLRYPPDPPTVEEIVAVMRAAGDSQEGVRLRGVIVVLWRAGLRISEALALTESDLDRGRGAVMVRHGKDGKRREVGMDRWAWDHLEPWLELRTSLPVGSVVLRAARPDTRSTVRASRDPRPAPRHRRSRRSQTPVRAAPTAARPRRRDVPRGVPLLVIQRQLEHADLAITTAYLRGIDNTEIIHTVHERPAPMIPATSRLAPRR